MGFPDPYRAGNQQSLRISLCEIPCVLYVGSPLVDRRFAGSTGKNKLSWRNWQTRTAQDRMG